MQLVLRNYLETRIFSFFLTVSSEHKILRKQCQFTQGKDRPAWVKKGVQIFRVQ